MPAALLLVLLVACGEAPPGEEPDPIFQDSLGLGPRDEVRSVEIRFGSGGESLTPDSLEIFPGQWVDFHAADGSPRTVGFVEEDLSGAARAFLAEASLLSSPPLLGRDAHWVVPFQGAPPGAYPYRVTGPLGSTAGVILVLPR